jgi:hypothetical protein
MKLLIMQFSPVSRHLISLRSKYFPQYPVLIQFQYDHRQSFKRNLDIPGPIPVCSIHANVFCAIFVFLNLTTCIVLFHFYIPAEFCSVTRNGEGKH